MGTCKQLLPLPDRPAVLRCVESITAAGIDDLVVVVGPEGDPVRKALDGLPVRFALNGDPGSDMAGSVRVGLAAIDRTSPAIFVCLCDHPLVESSTLAAMGRHLDEHPGAIIIPVHNGRKGHPTLFPRPILEEIHTLPTLREVIAGHRDAVRLLEVPDSGMLLDMDTPEEYQQVLDHLRLAGCNPA